MTSLQETAFATARPDLLHRGAVSWRRREARQVRRRASVQARTWTNLRSRLIASCSCSASPSSPTLRFGLRDSSSPAYAESIFANAHQQSLTRLDVLALFPGRLSGPSTDRQERDPHPRRSKRPRGRRRRDRRDVPCMTLTGADRSPRGLRVPVRRAMNAQRRCEGWLRTLRVREAVCRPLFREQRPMTRTVARDRELPAPARSPRRTSPRPMV